MSNITVKTSSNIFYKARYKASTHNEQLSSREGAADIMSIDRGRLYRIERDITNPYPEEIHLMADLYHAPELRNYYCRNCCPLGEDVPEIEAENLDRISIEALSTLHKAERVSQSLLDIVSDGIISEEEKPILKEIMMFLDDIDKTYHNLKAWTEKNL